MAALSAAIRAAEEPGFAAERDAAPRSARSAVLFVRQAPVIAGSGERVPAAQHVETGLGKIVASRELCDLGGEPGVELGREWRAELLADGETLGRGLAIDGALDIEQGLEPLHSFERDPIDHVLRWPRLILRAAPSTSASSKNLRLAWAKQAGSNKGAVGLVIAAIAIGLQDTFQ